MAHKRTIKPDSGGSKAQRAAARVMREPASSFKAGEAQRFAVAQSKARRAASGGKPRKK